MSAADIDIIAEGTQYAFCVPQQHGIYAQGNFLLFASKLLLSVPQIMQNM
jgi:hypothetical protein